MYPLWSEAPALCDTKVPEAFSGRIFSTLSLRFFFPFLSLSLVLSACLSLSLYSHAYTFLSHLSEQKTWWLYIYRDIIWVAIVTVVGVFFLLRGNIYFCTSDEENQFTIKAN